MKKMMIILVMLVFIVIIAACHKDREINNTAAERSSYDNNRNAEEDNPQVEVNLPTLEANIENNVDQEIADQNEVNEQDVTDNMITEEAMKEDNTEEDIVEEDNKEDITNEEILEEEQSEKDDAGIPQESTKPKDIQKETKENNEAGDNQEVRDLFINISNNNAPVYDISVGEIKPVTAIDPSMSTDWIDWLSDNPISVETSISENSLPADSNHGSNYTEEKFNVFDYTYDCVDGCWKFTETASKEFYFYSIHDESDSNNRSITPKMRRSYLAGDSFKIEYLDTEDWFYAPYEDEDGNIYAECGKYTSGGYKENADLYISKMDPLGKTLIKIRIGDLLDEDMSYQGFSCINKDIIAVFFNQSTDKTEPATQVQIIDIKEEKTVGIINLKDEVLPNTKCDENYFILISASYQRVYVFDRNTNELVNTVDTTKCKELSVYEWSINDWWVGKYANLSYDVDIKDGQLYFLRHSGIYVTDCMKSEFYQLLDGSLFEDFRNQLLRYTSFYAGNNNDFYILGVFVDDESAAAMWHYIKVD